LLGLWGRKCQRPPPVGAGPTTGFECFLFRPFLMGPTLLGSSIPLHAEFFRQAAVVLPLVSTFTGVPSNGWSVFVPRPTRKTGRLLFSLRNQVARLKSEVLTADPLVPPLPPQPLEPPLKIFSSIFPFDVGLVDRDRPPPWTQADGFRYLNYLHSLSLITAFFQCSHETLTTDVWSAWAFRKGGPTPPFCCHHPQSFPPYLRPPLKHISLTLPRVGGSGPPQTPSSTNRNCEVKNTPSLPPSFGSSSPPALVPVMLIRLVGSPFFIV